LSRFWCGSFQTSFLRTVGHNDRAVVEKSVSQLYSSLVSYISLGALMMEFLA